MSNHLEAELVCIRPRDVGAVLEAVYALGWSLGASGARELSYWDENGGEHPVASIAHLQGAFMGGAGMSLARLDDDAFLSMGPDSWLPEADFRISISHRGDTATEDEVQQLVLLWCTLARTVDLVAGYLSDEIGLELTFPRPGRRRLTRVHLDRWLAGAGAAAAVLWNPTRYDLATKAGIVIGGDEISCRLYQPTWRDQPLEAQLRTALYATP